MCVCVYVFGQIEPNILIFLCVCAVHGFDIFDFANIWFWLWFCQSNERAQNPHHQHRHYHFTRIMDQCINVDMQIFIFLVHKFMNFHEITAVNHRIHAIFVYHS